MKTEATFIQKFRQDAKHQLLKYAAGTQQFCPACKKVLDWKDTVTFMFCSPGGDPVSMTMCMVCYTHQDCRAEINRRRKAGARFYDFIRYKKFNTSKY